MYWADELAGQSDDPQLAARFRPLADALAENENDIDTELLAAQGAPVDIGGYYWPDVDKTTRAMRPSATFNRLLDGFGA